MGSRFVVLVLAVAACGRKDPGSAEPPVAVDPDPAPARSDAAPDPKVAAGAALWGTYCKLCHGARGEGYAADQAPSLISATFLATATDDFLRAGIARGRPGTAMAGYARTVGGPLDDIAIEQLIAFLRSGRPGPEPPAPPPTAGNPVRGKAVYEARCRECHGTDVARGKAPHLANAVFLETASDGFVRHAIVHGRPGTPMVAYGGVLDAADVDAVVTFIRTWARPAPRRPEPTPTQVKRPADIVINPKGKPPRFALREGRFVPAKQVARALAEKRRLIILDARAPSDWLLMHIPGSVPAPHYDPSALDGIPNDGTWIIAYCACPHHASGEVVDALRSRGYANTAVLDEGILVWDKLGFPIKRAAGAPKSQPPPTDHDGHVH